MVSDVIADMSIIFFESPIRTICILGVICGLICSIFRFLNSRIGWYKSLIVLVIITSAIFSVGFVAVNSVNDDPNQSIVTKIQSVIDPKQAMANEVSAAMDYTSPAIRDAALSMIKSSHNGSYNVGQVCDIFDYCYSHWVYVDKPYNKECFTSAKESVSLMRGDCDDFAIMMASLVQAIGGKTRVTIAHGADGKSYHAYAEVYLDTNKNNVDKLTDSISSLYDGATIHYSYSSNLSEDEEAWLNLDRLENHVGGKFFENRGACQSIYSNGRYEMFEWTGI